MNYLIISNSCVGYKIDLKLNGNKYLTPFVGSLIPNDLD